MARTFNIPTFYRSPIISALKSFRQRTDPRKRDLAPTVFDLGPLRFKLARHFGLCFGVENAIEIAYRALEENPSKRIFLLSEMIHNPHVNRDLSDRGVQFLRTPSGEVLVPFDELTPDDIVIVPAFGTTTTLFAELTARGINPTTYNTTCPFVERVWKKAARLGEEGFTIVIHGKHDHEETKATFSHAEIAGPSIVIRDKREAELLCQYITGDRPKTEFFKDFSYHLSDGFDPELHLSRIGVVNQTTMLATETWEISTLIREAFSTRYGEESMKEHFADTRDTLCYATSENQEAVRALIQSGGDVALVVGGYNSSNTSHLVELLMHAKIPTYYIKDADELLSLQEVRHLDLDSKEVHTSKGWYPLEREHPVEILLTAGASCPDALVDQVILRVAELAQVKEMIEPSLLRVCNQ